MGKQVSQFGPSKDPRQSYHGFFNRYGSMCMILSPYAEKWSRQESFWGQWKWKNSTRHAEYYGYQPGYQTGI